jgi:hypothetical protein
MKVIDLLNKIANGKEVPKKVRYNDEIYDTETSNNFSLMIYETTGKMSDDGEVRLFLNDEINIIEDKLEEEKKIPEKICTNRIINTKDILEFEMIQNKINAEYTYAINEIIDYLKNKGDE